MGFRLCKHRHPKHDRVVVTGDQTHGRYPLAQGTLKPSLDHKRAVERLHTNQAAFRQLEAEGRWLSAAHTAVGGELATSVVIPALDTPADSPLVGTVNPQVVLKRRQKINSILSHGQAWAQAFAEQQVQISTDLPVPDNGRLDLFVRFPLLPQKAVFAIALRSQGKNTVLYHEQKAALYVRNRSGGLKPWQPDHMKRLGLQEYGLRKNQQAFFGTASRDKNRSAVKLLVLTGQTKVGRHADALYTKVGDQRVLLLQGRSSLFVLQEAQILPFLQAWFAPRNGTGGAAHKVKAQGLNPKLAPGAKPTETPSSQGH